MIECTLPVYHYDSETTRKWLNIERKRSFIFKPTTGKTQFSSHTYWKKFGRKGNFKVTENTVEVHSLAKIYPDKVEIEKDSPEGMKIKTIKAPAGMIFDKDSLGILLKRKSDGMDYHLSSIDFEINNFATLVRAKMAENYKLRVRKKKEERATKKNKVEHARINKIYSREAPSCRVNLYDSKRAGNCIEGSLAFAERRLHMAREEIMECPWLVNAPARALLDSGDFRAQQAVRVAFERETQISI